MDFVATGLSRIATLSDAVALAALWEARLVRSSVDLVYADTVRGESMS